MSDQRAKSVLDTIADSEFSVMKLANTSGLMPTEPIPQSERKGATKDDVSPSTQQHVNSPSDPGAGNASAAAARARAPSEAPSAIGRGAYLAPPQRWQTLGSGQWHFFYEALVAFTGAPPHLSAAHRPTSGYAPAATPGAPRSQRSDGSHARHRSARAGCTLSKRSHVRGDGTPGSSRSVTWSG